MHTNQNNKTIFLKTKRLIIRNFAENDYMDLYEYLSDPHTYIYEPGEPISIEKSKKLCIERSFCNIFIAVELAADKKLIGHIYFNKIEPQEFNIYEIGYIFNKKNQGKGYATEAAKAVIDYAFTDLNAHKIIAHCNPKNEKSWKLLERAGLKREGELKQNVYFRKNEKGEALWQDTYEYGILKKDL
jgi:RimJ/RimL family protein N-acetyltransferase